MASGTMAAPPQNPAGAKGKAAPPPARRPFRAGVQSMEDPQYDNTRTLNASTQDLPDFALNGDGFLRKVIVIIQCTTAANAATVTFAQNGPFNVIDSIQFLDTSQRPIFGPFDGYTVAQINK